MFVGQIPLFAAKPRPQEAFDQGEEPLPVPRVTQMSAMRLGPRVAIGPKKGEAMAGCQARWMVYTGNSENHG